MSCFRINKINVVKILFSCAVVFLSLTSCNKKSQKDDTTSLNVESSIEIKKNHNWYYFTNENFIKVDKISNVPQQTTTPWTEAVRISSANNTTQNTADTNDNSKAFAIVNRLGIITFEGEKISLATDVTLFSDRTAGNLVFVNDTPLFSVYKSAFFNDTITDPNYKNDQSAHLFLVQFDDSANISYPLINCNNITLEKNSEITDFYWDGLIWTCSVKTISDVKNSFSYVKFKSTTPLLTLTPATCSQFISVEECNVDEYRKAKQYIDYKNAPQRIKGLLTAFDKKLPFVIEVKTAGGTSSRTFSNIISNGNSFSENSDKELQAKAILSQSWSATLFEDGTLFLEGALPGKHILRGGKPVAIKLPKLPVGFVYSDFVISGTTLYAAWEESAFFKTGRSGFLQVDLDKTLFSKVI